MSSHPGELLSAFLDWLAVHAVPFEVHEPAGVAAGPSRGWSVDIDPPLTKTTVVVDDAGNPHLLVLDASACLDLAAAAKALNRRWLTMLSGPERGHVAPDGDVEALPPVEALCGFPVHADEGIAPNLTLTFRGSDDSTVTVSRAVWEREAAIHYSKLAVDCREALEPIEWY